MIHAKVDLPVLPRSELEPHRFVDGTPTKRDGHAMDRPIAYGRNEFQSGPASKIAQGIDDRPDGIVLEKSTLLDPDCTAR